MNAPVELWVSFVCYRRGHVAHPRDGAYDKRGSVSLTNPSAVE